MRKDHRPLFIKNFLQWLNERYTDQIIRPQFDSLGIKPVIHRPDKLKLFGKNIHAGNHLHIICSAEHPVGISCWQSKQEQGKITIGDYVLISPGVKLLSASELRIEKNCMIAANCYISDSDWHGVYNRIRPFRCSSPVLLKENAWIGYGSTIGKGTTVGKNSIVAAGSVVVNDVPDNTIVGGNPAKKIKNINPEKRMLTREYLFKDQVGYARNQRKIAEYSLSDNRFHYWLKTLFFPTKHD